MTRTGAAARPTVEEQTESFIDWIRDHGRELSFAAIGIATVAAAAYLYGMSAKTKRENAVLALARAEQTLAAGRTPEAQTMLQELVRRYEGTPAGTQGALRLGQVLYDQGKYLEGVASLERTLSEYGSGPFEVPLRQLTAGGYEELGRPGDAAVRYLEAAEKASLEGERDELRARAARAFAAAGNKAEALRIWEALEGEESPFANEARIRIGELKTAAAGG